MPIMPIPKAMKDPKTKKLIRESHHGRVVGREAVEAVSGCVFERQSSASRCELESLSRGDYLKILN